MKNVCLEDYKYISEDKNIPWEKLENATVLVTGATGLIGISIIKALLFYEQNNRIGLKIVGLVRNKEKALKIYEDFLKSDVKLDFIVGDIVTPFSYEDSIDYIIHGASVTSSRMFVEKPVDTINTAIRGTTNILDFAREKQIKGMTYLSSMEIYGTPETDEKITEDNYKYINHMSARSSYPESKRMAECICKAYSVQHGLPVNVARLTQTFGPEVEYNDGRVFAEFARAVVEKRDIVLHTKGETKRCYLYTADAVKAILTLLLKGTAGEAYNVANEDTYCSVYEMAKLAADIDDTSSVNVKVILEDENKFGYAPTLKMNLDTNKINNLGFKAQVPLRDMFTRMIEYFEKED
ncbi:MAG: NAD-dependent epimerase/dehydratase family protein [Lachnospiraceae bacterium]|nr:NAD-dependent epimerase/dehydratase family protein [Lachnospiraceae bacterium]